MGGRPQHQSTAVDAFRNTVDKALAKLAQRRPIFHSEADFQYEFAREYHSLRPSDEIRLERPVRVDEVGTFNVDILIGIVGTWHAIELKYVTAGLTTLISNEEFRLRSQAAQDLRRYDIIKDILRLESLIVHGAVASGISVTITNDRTLWSESKHLDPVDAAFRLHNGRILAGSLAWHDRASAGTRKGREAVLELVGSFPLQWSEYSSLDTLRNGEFRQLVVPVV